MCEETAVDTGRAIMNDLDDIKGKMKEHIIHWLPSKKKFVTVLWIFNALLSHASGQNIDIPPRVFTQQPQGGSTVLENNLKVLLCSANGDPQPVYRWKKDGVFVSDQNSTKTTWVIDKLQESDAGEYQCMAANPHGAILSNRAQINVAYIKSFSSVSNREISVQQGHAAIIDLPFIDSYPEPSVNWNEGNGILIGSNSQRYHITKSNQLAVLETKLTDSDKQFRATAFNTFTGENYSSDAFILKVQGGGDSDANILPEIVIPPQHTTAVQPQDASATLECVANARPLNYVSLKWYKLQPTGEKEELFYNNKYVMSFYRRKLTIRNPGTEDTGVYECEAQFDSLGGSTVQSVSAQANLTIYVAPTFTNPPPVQLNTEFGSSATITCEATGTPTPVISWYRNAVEIDVTTHDRYTLEGTSLQITELEAGDTGMYQCFASNAAGETNGATYLRVFSSAPTIAAPPQNLSVLTGDVARFTCEVSGAPRPDITWFRVLPGVGVEEELPGVNSRIQVQDEELIINLSETEDSGKYLCNATNSKGTADAEAYLQVRVRTRIILPPQDRLVIKGSTIILTCTVEHDPSITPTWTWYHKGDIIPASDIRRRRKADGSLEIKSVRNTDIGVYRCEVTSEGGNGAEEAQITVIELPYQPSINSVSLNEEEKRAVDIVWTPGFDGNSEIVRFIMEYRLVPPGVQLFPEDGWLVSNDNIVASKTTYTVRGLQPARVYQFRVSAENGVGVGGASVASQEVEIPQEAPTGPPLDISGSPRSNNSIRVKWSPPEEYHWNGYLLGYNLRYKPSGYPDETLSYEDINHLVTLFDLVGLIVFQEYEIAVAAYNAKGVGVYSNYIKVRTREGIPTAPPTNVVATAETSTAIRIMWDPPDPQHINGINMGYKLMVMKLNAESTDIVTVPSDTSNILGRQSALLERLDKFTSYTVSVLCYTSVGNGPVSGTVTEETLEDVPDQVGSLRFVNILDTSLDVIWSAPEHSNGILTGYTLKYSVKNQPLSVVSKNFGPLVLNYSVSNLVATTQYTFEIFALTAKGPGPSRTADIESGVPPEIPEPPTSVAVTDIEGRSVTLRFSPGFDGHTSISKWIIEAQMETRVRRQTGSGGSGWFVLAEISDPDADTMEVTGLKPYTRYRLRITAVNVAGESDPSDPTDWFDTLQTAPNVPPADLDLRVLNETAIKIGWTPLAVEDWNGENRGYVLEARMSEMTAWNMKKQVTDQHAVSYILSGLEEYTTYDVRVAAFNNIGDSPYSGVVNVTTRESVPSAGPQSVQGTAVNSTSILVTWAPVPKMQQNGLIIGYKIQYSTTEANADVSYKEVEGSETVSAHVIGLKKFVEYRLQVLAFTRIGDGTLSSPAIIVKTHQDAPGPPSSVYFPEVDWTSVKVVWSAPTEPNGVIKGYQVKYRQDQDAPNNAVVNGGLEDYQREYAVGGLTRDTFYTFEISAKTSRGWGTPAVLKVRTILNRSVPDAPTAPQISNEDIGDRWVTISWQTGSDGYGPIRNFTIQYQQNEGLWATVTDYVPHTLSSFNVTGLKPNSNYKFHVAASNDKGRSDYSLPSRLVVTLQAAPESAPLNLQVEPKTKTSVLITWEEPPLDSWNSNPVGFRVYYYPASSDATSQYKSIPYPETSVLLEDLVIDTTYEARITAYNSKGTGPFSRPLEFFVGEAVPSAPPLNLVANTNSSTEIRVSWIPPPEDTHNGKLLGYKIFYQVSGENNSVQSLQVPVTMTTTVLHGLSIYTEYNFSILAYNRAGDGPNTTIQVYAWTDEGLPGPPGPLKFAVTSLSAVNVSWSSPTQENGVITKYLLSYYQEDTVDGERGSYQVEVTGRLYYFVNSLKERLKYAFSVKARTKVGWGNATEGTVTLGPQIGSPDRPSKPEITEGETSITLKWTTFYDGVSPIQGYIIQAKESDDSDWSPHFLRLETPDPEVVVPHSNLAVNTEYRFRIIAFNKDHVSEPSEPSDIFIREEASDPFYLQWWFLVIVALTGVIFIIMVIFILCLTGRNSKDKYKARRAIDKGGHNPNLHYFTYPAADQISRMPTTILQPSDTTQTFTDPVDSNDEGFATFDTRRSQRRSNRGPPSSRRSDITTLPPYSRTPPRPSPSSVNYSDPDEDRKSFPDSGSDITEKPSEPSDSEVGSQASQSDNEDYPDLAGAAAGASAAAPPRPNSFVSNYVANGDVRNSWKRQAHNKPFNAAYSYTDSEQDSSHYAMSLNGGVIMMNNMAGSRAPLPGFSSFV